MSDKNATKVQAWIDGEKFCAYTKPKIKGMLKNFSEKNDVSCSSVISSALQNFFNNMPAEERARYMPSQKNSY